MLFTRYALFRPNKDQYDESKGETGHIDPDTQPMLVRNCQLISSGTSDLLIMLGSTEGGGGNG